MSKRKEDKYAVLTFSKDIQQVLSSKTSELNLRNEKLDGISRDIKNLEKLFLRHGFVESSVFFEAIELCIFWNGSRIMCKYLDDDEKPLIECKACLRLASEGLLPELLNTCIQNTNKDL